MTLDDFKMLLEGAIENNAKFKLIVTQTGELEADPEYFGLDFDNGECYMFYNNSPNYLGQFLMDNKLVDTCPNLGQEFHYKIWNRVLEIVRMYEFGVC